MGCIALILLSSAFGILLLHNLYGTKNATFIVFLSQGMSIAATAYRYMAEISNSDNMRESTDSSWYLAVGRARLAAEVPPLEGLVIGDGTQNTFVTSHWFFTVLGDDEALVFLAGSTLGLLGLWFVAMAIRTAHLESHPIFGYLVCTTPSVVYWSSSFGKDSFTFFSLGICFWVVADVASKRQLHPFAMFAFILSSAFMFMIRLEIGVVLLVALTLSWCTVRSREVVSFRTGWLLLFFVGAPVGLLVASVTGVQDPWGVVRGFSGTYELTSIGGSAVEGERASGLTGLLEGFAIAFIRPFPWEYGLGGLISSLDVLVFVVAALVGLRAARRAYVWSLADARLIIFGSFIVIAVFAQVSQMANLGLLVRLRSLIIPILIAIIAIAIRPNRGESLAAPDGYLQQMSAARTAGCVARGSKNLPDNLGNLQTVAILREVR